MLELQIALKGLCSSFLDLREARMKISLKQQVKGITSDLNSFLEEKVL
jgi:hypothetical protein